MPRTPYPVDGIVSSAAGAVVSGATVVVTYQGDKLTATTNSSGQYLLDLANLPTGNDYANGIRFRIEAYTSNQYYSTTALVNLNVGETYQDITLSSVSTSNMHTLAQKIVYNILNSDNMVSYFGANLKDQIPPDLERGGGFPYIIINSPTISEERLTLGPARKFKDKVFLAVEIYSKIQKNVREVADAVRSALVSNQDTSRGGGLYWLNITRTSLAHTFYAGEETYPIWALTLGLEFMWTGDAQ